MRGLCSRNTSPEVSLWAITPIRIRRHPELGCAENLDLQSPEAAGLRLSVADATRVPAAAKSPTAKKPHSAKKPSKLKRRAVKRPGERKAAA